jgi:hypothetical protein
MEDRAGRISRRAAKGVGRKSYARRLIERREEAKWLEETNE